MAGLLGAGTLASRAAKADYGARPSSRQKEEQIMSSVARLLCILVVLAPFAVLGDEPPAGADQSSRIVVDKDKHTHITTISVAKELPIEIQTHIGSGIRCEPTMSITYEQRNDVARVEGTIENPSCAACSGDYTIAVRLRDASGESKTLEFPGTWQRADGRPVKFTEDYGIGTNVDVVNVRAKSLHCVCAESGKPAIGDAPKP